MEMFMFNFIVCVVLWTVKSKGCNRGAKVFKTAQASRILDPHKLV
jgi:hypothetical protein